MTMHERIMQGKLFTDMCEGMPEERLNAKKRMKQYHDCDPGDTEGRVKLLGEIFGKPCDAWIEPPFYFCYGRHISVGKGTYINVNCSFIDDGKINAVGTHEELLQSCSIYQEVYHSQQKGTVEGGVL